MFAMASVRPVGPASSLLMADWKSVHVSTLLGLRRLLAVWRKLSASAGAASSAR